MFATYLLDKTSGHRLESGRFRVRSHCEAYDALKEKQEKLFKRFQTGQWRVITRDENTGKEEEFPTL